jgi:hypothetical protein
MPRIHDTYINGALEKYSIDLLPNTVIKELSVVPPLKSNTVSVEAKTPLAGERGS